MNYTIKQVNARLKLLGCNEKFLPSNTYIGGEKAFEDLIRKLNWKDDAAVTEWCRKWIEFR